MEHEGDIENKTSFQFFEAILNLKGKKEVQNRSKC